MSRRERGRFVPIIAAALAVIAINAAVLFIRPGGLHGQPATPAATVTVVRRVPPQYIPVTIPVTVTAPTFATTTPTP